MMTAPEMTLMVVAVTPGKVTTGKVENGLVDDEEPPEKVLMTPPDTTTLFDAVFRTTICGAVSAYSIIR